MKRPRLELEREAIRDRLKAGERLTMLDVWRSTDLGSRSWAFDTLKRFRDEGLTHICEWRRQASGPMAPVHAWGKRRDAKKPEAFTVADKCRRYRTRMKTEEPERFAAMNRKYRFHLRKTPLMDPLMALATGYRRHGRNAWVKR